ncbi:DUF202 domain-containing protein [Naumannella halotolerans]|uniref:DUF202 domain-containing protein n=1 Tax=Naumannella halotolerans TaxID=993414 RepID=UPI00370D6AFE
MAGRRVASGPWDPGLQNERTWLAWQRTALSVLVCTLVMARLLAGHNAAAALVIAGLSTVAMLFLGLSGRHHYVRDQQRLHDGAPVSRIVLPSLLTALFLLLGSSAAIWVIITF